MELDQVLLLGSVVLLASILATRLGARFGLPSLLLFLGLGVLVGEFGLHINDADLAHSLGFAALVLILAEGGFTTKWQEIRGALPMAILLATVGVGVSVAAVAAFAFFVLGFDLPSAVLLGAITSPTDAAAIFAVMRRVPLPPRLRAIIEAESGFNDAPIVLLVATATSLSLGNGTESGPLAMGGLILLELAGGVALGAVMGWVGVQVLRAIKLPASGLYVLAAMGWTVLAYGLGSTIHLSGFAAVYVVAMVLGNGELPYRHATRSFAEGVGWIAQIGLFVMLGMLTDIFTITLWEVVAGIMVGAFLTFVARPLSVVICVSWFKLPWREQAFISWAGLRGAVPIIMATVPLAAGSPHALEVFNLVFSFVVVFTVLQSPTLPWVARALKVSSGDDATDIDIEFAPLDTIRADMMQVHVPEGSHLNGVTIRELRLPKNSVVSLIVRADEPFAPTMDDPIKIGDDLLIVTQAADRRRVEHRFIAISRGGRLARWTRD
ncbi:MAG: potassium/proton antiporter [Propionicimonas sp.]|uniref:potassium/proton antiporter n=1 Tax=Propionicimonas sp. TaxID=1955623 RepID=UPI002B1F0B14|nr:potassium/proton antiporter [Propionicimonas sp.]MEA4945899.1 potassium/proton antiporter [Propionicimonas sp.]MEA5055378.1 potassium/proton antiporter [Propionicimonas sp.]